MRVRPWQMPESTVWKSQTLWEESHGCENSWIVSGGCIVSGYSYYTSKNKIINGHSGATYKRPTNEDHLIAKQVNFYSRPSCKFLLNLITNVIAWLWNNKFGLYYQNWLTVWLFDECSRGTHCRKILCDGLQEPNFMGRFSLILEMGFGWNSIGHFGNISSALHVW